MKEARFAYSIQELEAVIPMDEYRRECVDVPKFLPCCQACPNYGQVWSCAPYDFDPMEIWNRYETLHLYAWMLLPDYPGQDVPAAMRALRVERLAYLTRILRREAAVPGSLALSAGSCLECGVCARAEGKPCRHPDRLRYSIESLGGDVVKTSERWLHKPLLWIRDGVVPSYLILVGGLLLPSGAAGAAGR